MSGFDPRQALRRCSLRGAKKRGSAHSGAEPLSHEPFGAPQYGSWGLCTGTVDRSTYAAIVPTCATYVLNQMIGRKMSR